MCGWEWFPKRRGMVSGIITSASGVSNSLFGFLTTGICNPHNIKREVNEHGASYFPESVADEVP